MYKLPWLDFGGATTRKVGKYIGKNEKNWKKLKLLKDWDLERYSPSIKPHLLSKF